MVIPAVKIRILNIADHEELLHLPGINWFIILNMN